MAKTKSVFFCTECGYETPKWLGQCPVCKEWNTFKEEIIQKGKNTSLISSHKKKTTIPRKIQDIAIGNTERIKTIDPELNRVLGGGIVPGSLILVGGQPGIGKSTLMLQLALSLSQKILYATGEESEEQIKLRAQRLSQQQEECYVYAETDIVKILKQADELEAEVMIIDSIQTMHTQSIENSAGSITQVRECTAILQHHCKDRSIPVFLIGHINKEGSLAGPKILEHIVDVVLQFEGDQHYSYRLLRTIKNRFGSTDELGIYAMQANGLRPVSNPSELLISQGEEELSGTAICASIEGQRPLLIESQGLVTTSIYGTPQRSATGFDLRRMSMLLAVLEKKCGLPFGQSDVFLNIAGGLKSTDPAIDLGVIVSLISSFQDLPIDRYTCFAGEVGLNGEVRAVSRIEQRIQEADRMGFTDIYVSKYNTISIDHTSLDITVHFLSKVEDLFEALFG